MKSIPLAALAAALLAGCAAADSAPTVTLTPLDDRVRVEIGGRLFTEYVFQGASRPYCHPVLAADGTSLVRDFPMKQTEGEEHDHPHHRALMFAHADANKIDFWNEGAAGTRFPKGRTVHDGFIETKGGAVGVIRARHRWVAPDGRLIATDETTLRFHGRGDARFIDYEVTIRARPEEPLVMGDNKDGTMAIRVAQWLTPPHKHQKKDVPGVGRYVTAAGATGAAVWGSRAPWCDLSAERGGRTYGIALFDHPRNLRHPTWWMARDYGLFAANPFGQKDFEPAAKHPPGKGDHAIPAGGSLTLRYRFYFHFGDAQAARVAARYAEYAAGK